VSKALEKQAKSAIEFVQKLYHEIAYLIKEVEIDGLNKLTDKTFIIYDAISKLLGDVLRDMLEVDN
jgi:hypothetical protein